MKRKNNYEQTHKSNEKKEITKLKHKTKMQQKIYNMVKEKIREAS